MITAQTVQLIDANNKNISPAVNIESLYFEGTISPTSPDTYRFALRDKLIVGGKLETLSAATNNGSTNLFIPYIYASKAFNATSGVWQIDSALYDIAPATKDFIDAVCIDKYAMISDVSANYLDLLGNNKMKGAIKMTDGVIYDTDGIETSDAKAYVHLSESGQNVEVYGTNSAKITADSNKTVIESNKTESYISYNASSATSKISTNATGIDIASEKDVDIDAANIDVSAKTKLSLYSSGSIDISAYNGEIDIYGDEIKLYDKTFPKPNGGTSKQLLSQKLNGEMEWMSLGHLDVYNFGNQSSAKQISYIIDSSITASKVQFEGASDSYPVLSDTDTMIKVKSLTSGDTVVSLDASSVSTVNLATINRNSILSSDDIILPTHSEIDTSINNKIKKADPAVTNVATVNITNDDNFEFTQTNVTINDDIVYARGFSMASDRAFKTDIREDCFTREMPAIHGFKWKDTSIQAYGFIAQELEENGFPEMVHENADGTKSVDYMTALSYKVARLEQENKRLWKALEELQKK